METPLGLTYTPFFPILQSVQKQMEQVRQQRALQAIEARKTAETRANAAVADYYKFNGGDRPYVNALEPYYQTMMKTGFDLAQKVRRGEADPQVLNEHMARYKESVNEGKRKDAVVSSFRKDWEKSGVMDLEYLDHKYSTYVVDLNSTAQLGTVTMNTPESWDVNAYVNDATLDVKSYNPKAMADKFVDELMKSEAAAIMEVDYAGNVINKDKTLKDSYISKKPGSAGQKTLEFGELDGEQSRGLLNTFRSMGPKFETYLKLRAEQENPGFKQLKPESDEWGRAMQSTLQKVMDESGRIPSTPSVSYVRPPAAPRATNFDMNFIGGSGKEEYRYMTEAKEYSKLFSEDETVRREALDMFYGKGVEDVQYVKDGHKTESGAVLSGSPRGYVRIKADRSNKETFNPLMALRAQGVVKDESAGVIYIPLDPNRLKSLSSYANNVRTQDLNPTYLRLAFDKLAGIEEAPVNVKKGTTTKKKIAGLNIE